MVEDWEINVLVRGELVKRFVNTKFVRISTNNGCVLVTGVLTFLGPPIDESHIPAILLKIEKDIRNIKGVRDLKLQFADWMKRDGKWTKIE
jgi:hypothetical protein